MALMDDERILLRGCRDGDERAWLALYRAYAGDVGLFLKAMLHSSYDVEDLVQKVFLEFLSSLDRFRGDSGIRTWLHSIARNVARHEIRGNARRAHHVRAYVETVAQEGTSPEGQVEARNRLSLIQGMLSELKEPFREVWVLRELVGLSPDETAAVLEVAVATVRTRHHRARQQILSLLKKLDGRDTRLLAGRPVHLKLTSSNGATP